MPEQRRNSHWSPSFLVRCGLTGTWRQDRQKHQKLRFWMSQHFHFTWSFRDFFVTHPKKHERKTATWVSAWNFICFAETRGFELCKCKFSLSNTVCKAFLLHLFISKTGSFFKMKTWAFGPSCGQIALQKVLFHFRKMNCCAGGVVFDCFKSSCQCFYFCFCLWTCCAFCPAIFSLHTKC